ncbi:MULTISPECIES: hypothetical protein [unclassified Acinetobacter]|uniref:hypothetical protein n=1 Tax=unclassified Acinetobacter TaxID=196816 RepID=UPI0035B97995
MTQTYKVKISMLIVYIVFAVISGIFLLLEFQKKVDLFDFGKFLYFTFFIVGLNLVYFGSRSLIITDIAIQQQNIFTQKTYHFLNYDEITHVNLQNFSRGRIEIEFLTKQGNKKWIKLNNYQQQEQLLAQLKQHIDFTQA